MRLIASVVVCVSIGGSAVALADPPAPNSAATPATPAAAATSAVPAAAAPAATDTTGGTPAHSVDATATPATAAPAAAAAAAPAIDPREKRLLSQGYRPQMVRGERVFRERETVMGSRTETVSRCGTVDQLVSETQLSREATENSQRIQLPASGH